MIALAKNVFTKCLKNSFTLWTQKTLIKFLFITLFLNLVFIQEALACQHMQIQPVSGTNTDLTFSPSREVTFVVKGSTLSEGCDFFVTVNYGGTSSYGSRRMTNGSYQWPYQIYKTAGQTQILKTLSDASSTSDIVTGSLSIGSNDRQAPISFWVQRDQSNEWLGAGNYTNNYQITLYKGTLSSYTMINQMNMSVNFNAPKRADISVVTSGSSFNIASTSETIDFGFLSTGQTSSRDVIVKTNSGYILRASSANNGRMKHHALEKYISYTMSMNGSNINLSTSSGSPVFIAEAAHNVISPATGFVFPVGITVGNVAGAESGNYKDTITFTIQAR